ncbi:lipopolysaccharide transport periplasmic protein LptA [Gynuella sp.]|uniref:lipopolysaccharide transport periplasmic protein LptA n=1 Tax=Gynuella sp. TaxID=2969146 RepID=UPI003D122C6E
MKSFTNTCTFLIMLVSLGICTPAVALPDDTKQPIKVKAKQSEYNNIKGVMTYSGQVEFQQGSIRLYADEVFIYLVDGSVTKMTANGKPAHFSQLLKAEDKQPLEAQGNYLEYNVNNGEILIDGDAKLNRTGNNMSGGKIRYNVKDGSGQANGGVEMTLQPDALGDQ